MQSSKPSYQPPTPPSSTVRPQQQQQQGGSIPKLLTELLQLLGWSGRALIHLASQTQHREVGAVSCTNEVLLAAFTVHTIWEAGWQQLPGTTLLQEYHTWLLLPNLLLHWAMQIDSG
jgi:hypothetical protein